jgi:hypothetical protein
VNAFDRAWVLARWSLGEDGARCEMAGCGHFIPIDDETTAADLAAAQVRHEAEAHPEGEAIP